MSGAQPAEAPEKPVDEQQGEAPEEEDHEHEEDVASESDSSEAESEGGEGSGAKKKKKKKKKKKRAGDAPAAAPQLDAATRKEAEKRFSEAVELIASGEEDSMWVKLDNAHIQDSKLSKLCDALRKNKQMLSLDLSANHISCTGALALAAVLREGGAPDLLELNLQDNPIDTEGQTALDELQMLRKNLKVITGPTEQQQQEQQQQPQAAAAAEGAGGGGDGSGSLADSLKNNALLRQFFQVGDEEEEESGGGDGGKEGGSAPPALLDSDGKLTAEHLSQLMWDQISSALDADAPYLPDISAPLRAVAEQVDEELSACQLPLLPDTCLDELKPFARQALSQLPLMGRILDLEPPALLTTYSRTDPVPAVGTHRAAVAELLSQLLRSECPSVAAAVAASGLLPRCAQLAIEHPNCNALHCSVVRCLRHALSPACGDTGLWRQVAGGSVLVDTGVWGPAAGAGAAAAASPRSVAAAPGAGAAGARAPCLAVAAARIADGARDVAVGKRSPHVGFALAAAEILQSASGAPTPASVAAAATKEQTNGTGEGSEGQQAAQQEAPEAEQQQQAAWRQELKALLEKSQPWHVFAAPEGPLQHLLEQQQGDLGGPRPGKDQEQHEDVGGGHIISGQELLMMLRGLNMGYAPS